jgi:UDP:flavonoid glycosyltransferase YjiC (YdhE family)
MTDPSHFGRLRPLIAGVAREGIEAHVFTHRRFEADVERAGGTFVDLFGRFPLDEADSESFPPSCRFVSFAGHYAGAILQELEALGPSLVLCGPFAVVGRVVAAALRVPHVNVCWGHNMPPDRAVPLLSSEWRRIRLSPSCLRAVVTLREQYGMEDASPYCFMRGLSGRLNLYCEPPEFLTESERAAFGPIAFYGSLPSLDGLQARETLPAPPLFENAERRRKVYVSFGRIAWRHFPDTAVDALHALCTSLGRREDVRAVVSLGESDLATETIRALSRPNVSVRSSVDQWQALREADVFVTHQGLNSTHEAIYHGVPMLAYPFFADQPALAERCRAYGLSVLLVDRPRSALAPEAVDAGLAELDARRESISASLARAKEWELETIANRPAVHRRIADLCEPG